MTPFDPDTLAEIADYNAGIDRAREADYDRTKPRRCPTCNRFAGRDGCEFCGEVES